MTNIEFQKFMDLIIHATKKRFLTEDLAISSLQKSRNKVVILLTDCLEDIDYKIIAYLEQYEENKYKVESFSIRIIHTDEDCYEFATFSSFEAKALVELETSLNVLLTDVYFNLEELEEVL